MVIRVSDFTDKCYTNRDGEIIFIKIKSHMDKNETANVSFKGIDAVTSSFVNSAFINLLEYYSFDYVKSHLTFSDTTRHINDLIKKRFIFEVEKRPEMKEDSKSRAGWVEARNPTAI